MYASVIWTHIIRELKRIDRPVKREELSYPPFVPALAKQFLSLTAEPGTDAIILFNANGSGRVMRPDQYQEVMDESDLQALLYMLQQIH
jgi:hypothetical protein